MPDQPRSSIRKLAWFAGPVLSLQALRALPGIACALAFFFIVSVAVQAQQPFVTDDADVTPKGRFHFEFSNEFDRLQRSSFPNLKQNTADFELDYGLFEGVEVGLAAPLLTIFNGRGTNPKTGTGVGDLNLSVKYNFRKEQENSRVPALALTLILNYRPATPNGSWDLDWRIST